MNKEEKLNLLLCLLSFRIQSIVEVFFQQKNSNWFFKHFKQFNRSVNSCLINVLQIHVLIWGQQKVMIMPDQSGNVFWLSKCIVQASFTTNTLTSATLLTKKQNVNNFIVVFNVRVGPLNPKTLNKLKLKQKMVAVICHLNVVSSDETNFSYIT